MKRDLLLKLKDLEVQEVIDQKIVKFGTGAHIIIPRRYIGKKAIVTITKD